VEVDVTGARIATVGALVLAVGIVITLAVRPWSLPEVDRAAVQSADFTALVDQPPSRTPSATGKSLDQDAASLLGPHFGARYYWAETNTHDLSGKYRAAAKHEFLILLGDRGMSGTYPVEPDDQVTAAVMVDGTSRPLAKVPTWGLVVSVPVGHKATLTVTDAGRTQSLDVRTGNREADAIAGYYRPRHLETSIREYKANGVAAANGHTVDLLISVDFYMASVSVQPWIPRYGWAPDGRAWLEMASVVVDVRVASHSRSDNLFAYVMRHSTDFPKTFTIAVGGAFEVAAKPGTADGIFVTSRIVFDVPAGFSTGTLGIRPTGTLRDAKGASVPYVWRQAPASGQLALRPR
jgi:hypothetical protein